LTAPYRDPPATGKRDLIPMVTGSVTMRRNAIVNSARLQQNAGVTNTVNDVTTFAPALTNRSHKRPTMSPGGFPGTAQSQVRAQAGMKK